MTFFNVIGFISLRSFYSIGGAIIFSMALTINKNAKLSCNVSIYDYFMHVCRLECVCVCVCVSNSVSALLKF